MRPILDLLAKQKLVLITGHEKERLSARKLSNYSILIDNISFLSPHKMITGHTR